MISIIVLFGVFAVSLAANSVDVCARPFRHDCEDLRTQETCEEIPECKFEHGYCGCRNDGLFSNFGFTSRLWCNLNGYSCEQFNKAGVGITDACPLASGACVKKTLTGAEKDEWIGLRHSVDQNGCLGFESLDALRAGQKSRLGLCVQRPETQDEAGLLVTPENVCVQKYEGIVASNLEVINGDPNFQDSLFACRKDQVCCLPQRKVDTSLIGLVGDAIVSDSKVRVYSPARLDIDFGFNYWIGEEVEFRFDFNRELAGKVVEARIHSARDTSRSGRKANYWKQSFTLPTDKLTVETRILLLGDLYPGQRYVIQFYRLDSDFQEVEIETYSPPFRVEAIPCFDSLRDAYRDRKSWNFGGICVPSERQCQFEDSVYEFHPNKYCKNIKDSTYGCCVPKTGSFEANFRSQKSPQLEAAGSSALIVAPLSILIAMVMKLI